MQICGIFSDNQSEADRRAQSETIGFVLLFSLVLIGSAAVIGFGAVAVADSEESLSADRAEKVMTQMDSEISMVALGRTDSQQIQFDRASDEDFTVDEEAGTINITTLDDDGSVVDEIMEDVDLGAVVFERDDTKIAYQGGGVWRTDGAEGSGMVSPPEFNYRDQTLTLPLVTVSGDANLGSGAVIQKGGDSTTYFPVDGNENLSNPLEDEIVQVTVETEYHQGWKSYFETRTSGDVLYEPEHNRVSVNLTAPAVEDFEHGAATTQNNGVNTGPNGEIVGSSREGIDAPSVSPDVEDEIEKCESGEEDCTDISDGVDDGDVLDNQRYNTSGDLSIDEDIEFDTSDGDITVAVDGELNFQGNSDVTITGDNQVQFYVNRSVDIQGTPNTGDDPEDLVLFVHTEAENVTTGGNLQFSGYIYAPGSGFEIDGGGGEDENIVGGVVAESADLGNGIIEHKNEDNFGVELGAPTNVLTFLHISTNPVEITDD